MILFYPVLQNDLSSIWCYQVLHFDPTILHHPVISSGRMALSALVP